MSLKAELDAFRDAFMGNAPPEVRAAMARADAALAASGIVAGARKAGDAAPDFVLPAARGGAVRLRDLLRHGPVVLSFYRGGWCPYCNLTLRALQAVLPAIHCHGAELVAISPQTPAGSRDTAEANRLAFPVLSDSGSAVARSFGIAFDLAEELRPIYARFGHALPDRNGDAGWVLPIPATYVIGADGVISFAFLDSDYRNRLEPDDILACLAAMRRAA